MQAAHSLSITAPIPPGNTGMAADNVDSDDNKGNDDGNKDIANKENKALAVLVPALGMDTGKTVDIADTFALDKAAVCHPLNQHC